MSDNTKKRMEEAILNCAKKAEAIGVWDAARDVIGMQTTAVTREFAVSRLVDEVRHRERLATLTAEREAEISTATENVTASRRKSPWSAEFLEQERIKRAASGQRLLAIANDLTDGLRIKWTQELLASSFGMPDGTSVTWGEATIEQHQIRAAMFSSNAQANIEGAARHQKAIQDLAESGVPTLGELTFGEVSRAC